MDRHPFATLVTLGKIDSRANDILALAQASLRPL